MVTVGALYMGMDDFSTTINREFQVSAEVAERSGVEEENKARDDKKKKDEEEKQNQWRIRRDEDRQPSDRKDLK